MSRLTDLIARAKAKDPELGNELEREIKALSSRRAFGLNFERHSPESVELPGCPIRKGYKVRILPLRGSLEKGDKSLWIVRKLQGRGKARSATLEKVIGDVTEEATSLVTDLVVVAEFRDYIYPGLVSTGRVERGGDKPYHTVINGENFHALEALTYTHRGKIDVIYIDPPYNTGAKDWKYNNDYVEGDDLYRHSKWLAFMERRLKVARQLLNPQNATLIVSIDEKEYLRLGLLLEQVFPEARIQMISSVINPRAGVAIPGSFTRIEEYIYILQFGEAQVVPALFSGDEAIPRNNAPIWFSLMRTGTESSRNDRPNLFYPIWVNEDNRFHSVGAPLQLEQNRQDVKPPAEGLTAIWPLRPNGSENRWQLSAESIKIAFSEGWARVNISRNRMTVNYLRRAERQRIESGDILITGRDDNGAFILEHTNDRRRITAPKTVWQHAAHDAGLYGSSLLRNFLPSAFFPFPKSLYAVEDALRFFVSDKPNAIVLDFFSGSGTTAHAVMRLNKQYGGRRQCISITNNEVAAKELRALRQQGLRPGDSEWEQWGICDYITKPRIKAAITGQTPDGDPINGDYNFTDEFPMAYGFEENAEFFTLTYETPVSVSHNRAFARIAPLLWMKAGSEGRRIDKLPDEGWAVVDAYGLLTNLDKTAEIVTRMHEATTIRMAFIVTDDERRFQSIVRQLPKGVEPVRLYESYLTNFRFAMGR